MTFALCLQLPNYFKFNKKSDIYTNFIPQMIFLQCLFGYLVICILYKWTVDWSEATTQPPSLLNMLIGMFLSPGTVDPELQLYPGQGLVQLVLLFLALICVPILLIAKPYLIWKEMKAHKDQGYINLPAGDQEPFTGANNGARVSSDEQLEGEEEGNGRAIIEDTEEEVSFHYSRESEVLNIMQGEHEEFGEVVIHQIIHTIEFCLGCISHTASYLRLWALSLAHAQLSEVLWHMTMDNALPAQGILGWIILIVCTAFWFVLTVAILCLMEGLSAFLHALRLHWVEANSKHFLGDGHVSVLCFFACELESLMLL